MTQFETSARDTAPPAGRRQQQLTQIQRQLGTRLLGKPRRIKLALTCLLAGGHLLIEDRPGVGKTTLARALAQVFALSFARIQFTSDLLPGDILGTSVYDRNEAAFHFHAGPIFAQLVLADEINRASPKTQSALLEAMAERQVSNEGQTRPLTPPFHVIATQNPAEHDGTFALPQSQLDRFLMCIDLGYPAPTAEKALLRNSDRHTAMAPLTAMADGADLLTWQHAASAVQTSDALLDYVLRLLTASRDKGTFRQGLSPRAGLALGRAAQAWALLDKRDFVLPEDVQAVLPAVVDHRLQATAHTAGGNTAEPASAQLLAQVDAG